MRLHLFRKPCRDCDPDFSYDECCPVPITPDNQSAENHLLCHFCYEYMPSKGEEPDTPGLDQCCLYFIILLRFRFFFFFTYTKWLVGNFCGVISCDSYWGCSDQDDKSKLYVLRGMAIFHIICFFRFAHHKL
jgi:hypothetical protein